MTKVTAASISCLLLPLAFVVACGAGKTEPATLHQPPSEGVPAAGDAGAAALATPDASGAAMPTEAPPGAADAGGAAPAPATPAVVIGETKDECTPVGVEFEKRARPKLKECYVQGKKKAPNLEGTVKIKITVDVKGKIKSTKIVDKTLPDPVADCMLKVIKTTPFPEVDKCWDATLTIPITFPTPR